jgi:Dolichyl-phosphate-mannose-protein mannosyltransferase
MRTVADKLCVWILGVLVAYTIARCVLAAASKPFWYDEIFTWVMAHMPTLSALWNALTRAADTNPPVYLVVERVFDALTKNEEVGLRLPSILGFACTLICIFVYVGRRSEPWVALACSAILMRTILFDRYAIEARPYSLVVACIAIALVCYQHAPAMRWMILMGASLALGTSLHYYAVFALVPFALAEGAQFLKVRRIRWCVWIAIICGVMPLAIFWPLLAGLRRYFGPHFWGRPTLESTADTYGWFFEASHPANIAIATVLLLCAAAGVVLLVFRSDVREKLIRSQRFHEYVLVVTLLGLPFIAFAGARTGHGGWNHRYALAGVLGVPLAAGYILRHWKRSIVAMLAIFIFYAVAAQEVRFWTSYSHNGWGFTSPAASVEDFIDSSGRADLPVVISDGIQFLPIAHYASSLHPGSVVDSGPSSDEWAKRFVDLVDPAESLADMGDDSIDKGLLALQTCIPLRVEEFETFAKEHPVFLLFSDGDIDFDRWPERLTRNGHPLQILRRNGNWNLYLVNLKESSR